MPRAALASVDALKEELAAAPAPSQEARAAAEARNQRLTKPPAALGRLEEIALWFATWANDPRPRLAAPQILIFAGNHGIAARGVSAFPAEVTAQMVANFEAGGAAINQLAEAFGARLDVYPLRLETPTRDFTAGPALDEGAFLESLNTGWQAVDPKSDLVITGEMGIANTTAAAAVAAGLFGGTGADWAGRGTGLADEGVRLKAALIDEALRANPGRDPLEVLRCLGGRELTAMAGAIARARAEGIPVLLDGFINTAAAAALERAVPGALDHAMAAHVSAEAAHARLLRELGKAPILSLGMRLGEGSGAALALGIVKGALACHSGMATFDEAGVSEG